MGLFDDIKKALGNQPYEARCADCGSDLDIESAEIDNDFDMFVRVGACQTCIDNAVEEAKAE